MEISALKSEHKLVHAAGHEPVIGYADIEKAKNDFSFEKDIHLSQNASNDENYQFEIPKNPLEKFIKFGQFIGEKILGYSTGISAGMNLISSIFRLMEDSNPFKKIINSFSMLLTKVHQVLYSMNGLSSGLDQKNPILSFSFGIEGLASMFNLRKMYLFRGIATALDALPAALENKTKKRFFSSFKEGGMKSWKAFKEVLTEIKNKPKNVLDEIKNIGSSGDSGTRTLVVSSLVTILGSIFGLGVDESIGGSVRDFSGAFGDLGLTMKEDRLAKLSGFFYALGSGKDFIARIFNSKIANWLGIQDVDKFTRFRDFFHELSIASDKFGQLFFAKYNQQAEKNYA